MTDDEIKRLRGEARWGGPIILQRTDLAALLDEVESLRAANSDLQLHFDALRHDVDRHIVTASTEATRAERAEKVATAAQVWAGDKVVGDPNADRRLAEAIIEYEAAMAPAEPAGAPQVDIIGDVRRRGW